MCNTLENMNKLTLLFLLSLSVNSYCQKNIGITENKISKYFYKNLDSLNAKYDLKDLRESENIAIRIWLRNEIISLEKNSEYIFYTSNGQKDFIEVRNLEKKTNLDSLYHLFKSSSNFKNKLHIDAFPIKIELSNSNSYDLISFQRNDQLEEIIQNIRKKHSLDELRNEIKNNLPAGNYRMGTTSLRKDYLPKEDKSDFYLKLEPEIKAKLKISEKSNPTEMPLIIIDDIPGFYFEDLNNLKLSDVKDYEIINDKAKVLYGTRARFGIIKVNTN